MIAQAGDLFMCCSDYPHSEGTAQPLPDYRAPGRHGIAPEEQPGFFSSNADFLLGRDAPSGSRAGTRA
ncbi:MAG: hypothetical protein JSU66_16330 [Deltaproteobacteria bacterium]|nr:MAG: hypothetical protein JSU66_16330 [Deltaproteobacteria bacterium]